MTPEELRELAGRYKDFGENQFAKFLNAAADEIERRRRDAERYRWLRSNSWPFNEGWDHDSSQLDEVIDAALEGK